MSEFRLPSGNLLRIGTIAGAIAALCVACSRSEKVAARSKATTYGQVVTDFRTRLGISPTYNAAYYRSTGMSPQELEADLQSRTSTLADSSTLLAAYSGGEFQPADVEAEYNQPGADKTYYPSWTLPIDVPGSGFKMFSPILRISRGSSGRIQLTDQRPPLSRQNMLTQGAYQRLLRQAILPSEGLIGLSIDQGAIEDVEVVYDDNSTAIERVRGAESSFYDSRKREEVIVLQKSQPTSNEEIISTEVHENGHAWFSRSPDSILNNSLDSSIDASYLRQACEELRSATFDEAKSKWAELITLYQEYKTINPHLGPEIDYIVGKIENGELDDLQYTVDNLGGKKVGFPECEATNAVGIINVSSMLLSESKDHYQAVMPSEYELNDRLNQVFDEIYRSTPIMRAISEFGYVADRSAGHPEDGIDELAASLFDIALTHPLEFEDKVEALSAENAGVIKNVYRQVRRAYIKANPNLRDVLPQLFEAPKN